MTKLKWGFINKTGEYVLKPIFDGLGDFHNGLAKFKVGEKWGYIDKEGYVVIEPEYDEADSAFSEGLAWVQKGDEYLCINPQGRIVFGDKMAEGGSFHDGLATFGRGYLNQSGRCVTGQIYDSTGQFQDGIAIVKYQGSWCCIDTSGEVVFSFPHIDRLIDRSFNDGLLRVLSGNKVGFVDTTGKFVIRPKFEQADIFCDGLACVCIDEKQGYIDKTGKFVIEPKFDQIRMFREGLAAIMLNGKFGYIDQKGTIVIEPRYESVDSFYGGYARVLHNGKYGVIDKTGNKLYELNYELEFIHDFNEDLAMVICKGRKYGYIDATRKLAIEPIYNEAGDFHEGLAKVGVAIETDTYAAFENLPRRPKATPEVFKHPSKEHSTKSGCYVATAVYGSYDCPEVWTLRRYRDNVLDNTWYGKLFIRTYYAISPTLVKWFGTTNWFREIFLKPLNKWVVRLNKLGFANTPYQDKY